MREFIENTNRLETRKIHAINLTTLSPMEITKRKLEKQKAC
jgi:acid stress-induced BolA-like protein IbaG/YrbA